MNPFIETQLFIGKFSALHRIISHNDWKLSMECLTGSVYGLVYGSYFSEEFH
jgi:hypothetical protein